MEDVVAALDGFRPALVAGQVRREHRQAIARVDLGTDRRSHLGLAGKAANRRPHRVALAQQLDHAPATEEAGAAGDQDRLLGIVSHVDINPILSGWAAARRGGEVRSAGA